MHCTEHHTMRTRLLHTLAAAALSVAGLLLLPAANAQMNPPQARPQAQSPSPAISDAKLNAAAFDGSQAAVFAIPAREGLTGLTPS